MWAAILPLIDKFWKPVAAFFGTLWLTFKAKKEQKQADTIANQKETAKTVAVINAKAKTNDKIEETNAAKSAAALRDELRRDG